MMTRPGTRDAILSFGAIACVLIELLFVASTWFHPISIATAGVLISVAYLTTIGLFMFVREYPKGHCRRCGYNLTGLRGTYCPECGTTFERGR